MKAIYEYDGYRPFLRDQFPGSGSTRGRRKVLADLLGCQPSFISLVITERAHMSEEMLLSVTEFLRLTNFEIDYLLLLYHHERAGSKKLEAFYTKKIEIAKAEHSQVEAALNAKTEFTIENQIQYYSSWLYAAVHIACTLSDKMTIERLGHFLEVSVDDVGNVIRFLLDIGLIAKNGSGYSSTSKRIHLSRESPLSIGSHSSWRIESVRHIQKKSDKNLHFSSVYSLSKKDFFKIRKVLEEQILSCEQIIAPSKEEQLGVLNIDWFSYGGFE